MPPLNGAVTSRGIEVVPTLVVEVLSPSTLSIDRNTKQQLYARFDVPFFWLVDPESRTIEAFALGSGGYTRVTRAAGVEPVALPPLSDLAFVPASLWP
jgi:Uma2 family endonuclease